MTKRGVGKVIDLLQIHGKALIHKLGDLSQGLSVPLVFYKAQTDEWINVKSPS
jgi:hypothetical protein